MMMMMMRERHREAQKADPDLDYALMQRKRCFWTGFVILLEGMAVN